MSTSIDETGLARLAQLSADHEMPEIIGALVAEIRRLREKIEAWEWFEECFEVTQWLMANGQATPESRIVDVLSSNARVESVISTNFARERAVHADRE